MPCYEVNLVSQKFQVKHLDVLKEAAMALGMNFNSSNTVVKIGYPGREMNIDLQKETILGRSIEDINLLKRTYAEKGMRKYANKYGWQTQKKKENEFLLMKY